MKEGKEGKHEVMKQKLTNVQWSRMERLKVVIHKWQFHLGLDIENQRETIQQIMLVALKKGFLIIEKFLSLKKEINKFDYIRIRH